jgi:transcriptional regulator, GntR family
MNQLLDTQQLPYRTIERTLKGIDLENLEEIFKSGHIKFFYTIPRFHYPLGHSYSPKEKEAILQLADQYDVYLVEDDYLADLDASNAPSFHYLDRNNRVIYIKSFSTNLFSALRITSMILPKELLKPVLTYKTILDYDSNLIMQKALSLYIDNGMYLTNKKRLLARRKEEETNLKTLISQSSLLSQLTLNHDGVLVDLSHVRSLAALKHSGLPLDFFEAAYIANCPYQLVKIKSADVARVLPELSSLFKTENLV